MPMPKHSSKSKKDWVSGTDVVHARVPKRAWISLGVIAVVAFELFFIFGPKAVVVENIVPSVSMVFVRNRDVHEHLTTLRASRFWKIFSKVDMPKLLEH